MSLWQAHKLYFRRIEMEELRVITDFRIMAFTAKKGDLIIRTKNTTKLIFVRDDSRKIETITICNENFSYSELSRLDDCILLYTE
jgi:hypothetical protein